MVWYRPLNTTSTRFSNNLQDWPAGATRKTFYGQHVLWHEYSEKQRRDDEHSSSLETNGRHLSASALAPYRQVGDAPVDEILELWEDEKRSGIAPGDDIVARAARAFEEKKKNPEESASSSSLDAALTQFYERYQRLPSWVDEAQLERGQEVYLAYLPAMALSLYYRSLVPGFSLPPLARVLQRTGYLAPPASPARVQARLIDTGALLALTMALPTALLAPPPSAADNDDKEEGSDNVAAGEGWKACLQVRILHAKVRRALLKKRQRQKQPDTPEDTDNDVPLNEEDMAATLLAFSVNALVGVEILLWGWPLPLQERLDFVALWRYLGWLLGVRVVQDTNDSTTVLPRPLDPCGPGWLDHKPNPLDHAYALLQSIVAHLLHPDETSSVPMAHFLLWQGRAKEVQAGAPSAKEADQEQRQQQHRENWFYYRCLQCRRFVGNDLADALQLPLHPHRWRRWRSWCFSTAILTVISLYTVLALPWSPVRPYIVAFHRRRLLQFAQTWKVDHQNRVQERLAAKSQASSSSSSTPPTCQFALLFAPQ